MPDRLAGYTTVSVISQALYGDVTKLRHVRTGELVAFKRMELASATQHRSKQMHHLVEDDAFAELQTNMRIRMLGGHANIVALKDCWIDRKVAGMLSEYCAHGELLDVVNARNAALTIPEALRYFRQILQGTSFLHAHGMSHRDLSLENVLVDAQDVCKLTDFGMATTKRVSKATGVGKVLYMSPEAMRGHNLEYDPMPSDLWSLGVLLFTLLVGQYPFQAAVEDDQHFRLLDLFGVDFLLARFDFPTTAEDAEVDDDFADLVDLLSCLLCIDPRHRVPAAQLLQHPAFERITEAGLTVVPVHRLQALSPPPPLSTLSSGTLSLRSSLQSSTTKSRLAPMIPRPSVSTNHSNPASTSIFGRSQRRSSLLDTLSVVKAEQGSMVPSTLLHSSRQRSGRSRSDAASTQKHRSLPRRALQRVLHHVFNPDREWTPAFGCCVATR